MRAIAIKGHEMHAEEMRQFLRRGLRVLGYLMGILAFVALGTALIMYWLQNFGSSYPTFF
jgi:hypothetical protein